MKFVIIICTCLAAVYVKADNIQWPHGERVAVSLSYDDALNSQLDNAIPALNEYGLRGSFYLTLASEVTQLRLNEWRQASENGHELGNHTIYHPCSKTQPGTEWVKSYNDIDQRTVAQMREEIMVANGYLHAIDGKTTRTFTPPCGHLITRDGNYLTGVEDLFVAIKGNETQLPDGFSVIALPNGESGPELIEYVKKASQQSGLIQIIFHGIGGDHLAVSNEAHRELLAYLKNNDDIYWTDTYLTIMQHVQQQR